MKLWMWWVLVVIAVSGLVRRRARTPVGRVTWIPFRLRGQAARHRRELPAVCAVRLVLRGVASEWARVAATIGWAAAVSLAVEIPQLFYRLRDPSATDVVMAMCGAAGSIAFQAFHGANARARRAGARHARPAANSSIPRRPRPRRHPSFASRTIPPVTVLSPTARRRGRGSRRWPRGPAPVS